LIAMGEDIGGEMAFRAFGHLVSTLLGLSPQIDLGQRNQLVEIEFVLLLGQK